MALSLRRPVTVLIVATILFFMPSCCLSEQAPKYSFLKDATKAPPVSYYDYIIVGGGTAGCPLAATLSQSFRVLLLERGGSPYGNKNVSDIAHFADTLADVSPSSPSQLFVSEDGVILTRARILGGASCLNAGFYSHAGPDYAAAAGWDGALANESYRWVEGTVAFEPEMKGWQSAFRDGLLEAGVTPYNGFTYDHLRGTKVGGTIFDKDGNRHTAADLLQHADPRRLTVLLHGTALKILFRHKGRARAVAHGVVFRDSKGVKHKAYLYGRSKNNEIIVSSGAMGSPQLLMLSGVGPRRHLESLGIPVVLDQPWVGQGMSDNPMNAVFVPSPVPVEASLIQVVGITSYGGFIEGASGAFFSKFTPNSSPSSDEKPSMLRDLGMFSPQTGQLSTVPPKQRTPEAIASAVEAMNKLSEKSLLQGGYIIEKIMGPLSTGHLELRSRNPDDTPSVTFNYFKEAEDLRRCVQGMKTIEKVVQSKAFSAFKYPDMSNEALLNLTLSFPVNFLPRHNNDLTSMEQFCKDTVMTIWHYHGGCHVGKVVDRDLKVLGVDQLRVVDSSTFKFSPGTNPQATVMMLGRYMGVKMLDERLAS